VAVVALNLVPHPEIQTCTSAERITASSTPARCINSWAKMRAIKLSNEYVQDFQLNKSYRRRQSPLTDLGVARNRALRAAAARAAITDGLYFSSQECNTFGSVLVAFQRLFTSVGQAECYRRAHSPQAMLFAARASGVLHSHIIAGSFFPDNVQSVIKTSLSKQHMSVPAFLGGAKVCRRFWPYCSLLHALTGFTRSCEL
jgi:hypothetical protein